MSASQIRKELHNFIDQADERILKLLYGMMTADQNEDPELSEAIKQILDDRLAAHRANPTEGATWSEVKARVIKK